MRFLLAPRESTFICRSLPSPTDSPRSGLQQSKPAPGEGPQGSIAEPLQPQPEALEGTDVTSPTAGPEYSATEVPEDGPDALRSERHRKPAPRRRHPLRWFLI